MIWVYISAEMVIIHLKRSVSSNKSEIVIEQALKLAPGFNPAQLIRNRITFQSSQQR